MTATDLVQMVQFAGGGLDAAQQPVPERPAAGLGIEESPEARDLCWFVTAGTQGVVTVPEGFVFVCAKPGHGCAGETVSDPEDATPFCPACFDEVMAGRRPVEERALYLAAGRSGHGPWVRRFAELCVRHG